jgi:hypothetical protein
MRSLAQTEWNDAADRRMQCRTIGCPLARGSKLETNEEKKKKEQEKAARRQANIGEGALRFAGSGRSDVWPGIGVRYSACAAYLQRPVVAADSIQEAAKGNTTKRDLTCSTIAHPLSCWPVLNWMAAAAPEGKQAVLGRDEPQPVDWLSARSDSRPHLGLQPTLVRAWAHARDKMKHRRQPINGCTVYTSPFVLRACRH